MSKKAKSTGKAKPGRKRSTAMDLSAKNARSVKGGTGPTAAASMNYSKMEMEYRKS